MLQKRSRRLESCNRRLGDWEPLVLPEGGTAHPLVALRVLQPQPQNLPAVAQAAFQLIFLILLLSQFLVLAFWWFDRVANLALFGESEV